MAAQAMIGKLAALAGVSRSAARARKRTLFLEFTIVFALVALVLVLLVGFIATRYLASDIRATALNDSETEVTEVVGPYIARNLSPELLAAPLTGADLAAFDTAVRQGVLSSRTVRLNVFNSDGVLVYSSAETASGVTPVERVPTQAALQREVVSVTGTPSSLGEPGLESYTELARIGVPLTENGSTQAMGVAEVYRDFTSIAGNVNAIERSIFISMAVVLGTLYLALVIVVRRRSNAISHQEDTLQSRTDELKSSYNSIIAVLCAALDLHDNVTQGRSRHIAETASVVAWQMGLRKEQMRQIEKAAILHDIGKIGVADAVLAKAGPLDDSEWVEMKRHPELGHKIINEIDFLRDAAEVIHAHHERYDGSGYPRGLKGEEIPLGARIYAVVDAYVAMTSHRPYRKTLPHRLAIEELVRNANSQFDPEVVRAFLEAEKQGLLDDEPGRRNSEASLTATGSGKRSPSAAGD
ncbi:MAG: HD-GYP domain-containing protein [Chloroflexi bacterium]|nr:HD-GYP domain-containing protein [Chloroflexota bacterium]